MYVPRLRCVLGIAVVLGPLSAAVVDARAAAADALPRYKLKVGQQLTYQTVAEEAPSNNNPTTWTLIVVAQNPDKSWRVYFTQAARSGTRDGYFDLAADGRLTENRTLTPFANPTPLVPPLAPDEASLVSSWSTEMGLDDTKRKFHSDAEPQDGRWEFSEDPQTVFSPVYLIQTHRQYVFDVAKGLVTDVTTSSTQGWPAGRSDEPVVQRIKLADDAMLADADVAALADEMNAYIAACADYDKLTARADQDFAHSAELLDQAQAGLKEALAGFQQPLLKKGAQTRLIGHSVLRKYTLESAEQFGKLLGQPSAAWETTDLEGNPRSLADYHGKVVLLDFWYRGCGWCIRAMPQIKQLANDFKDEPVVILGMNNDRDLEDANFVIDKMGLNYASLKNGREDGINEHYNITGWPTLVMLDGQGVVRSIHVGYSPNLREELGEKIRELLAEK